MQTSDSTENIFICTGTNVPLRLQVGSCSLNTANNVLEWNFNGSTEIQYAHSMGGILVVSGDSNRFRISNVSNMNDNLNFTSMVRLTYSDLKCTSLQCGSNLFHSDVIYFGKGFLVQ